MCSGQCYGVKMGKDGRRGRKSCASCSAATCGGVQLADWIERWARLAAA